MLQSLAKRESIFTTERTVRRIVKYWQETGSIADKESLTRSNNLTKITVGELKALDKLIYRRRETTANTAKNELNLRASTRTVEKYLNKLGWKKISTKFCHFVSEKNHIERFFFCNFCKISKEVFDYSIFLDKCTVMMNKNARTQWFRNSLAGETKSGLRPKYKHAASIHLKGGISRRGRTKLMIFSGMLNGPGFMELADKFWKNLYAPGGAYNPSIICTRYFFHTFGLRNFL